MFVLKVNCLLLCLIGYIHGLRFLHYHEGQNIAEDVVYITHNDHRHPSSRYRRDIPDMPDDFSFHFEHDGQKIQFNLTRGKHHLKTPLFLADEDGIPYKVDPLPKKQLVEEKSGVYRSKNKDGVFMVQKSRNDSNNYILAGTFFVGNKEFTLKPGREEDEHQGLHYIQDHSLGKRSARTSERVALNYGHDWKYETSGNGADTHKPTRKPPPQSMKHDQHHNLDRQKRQVSSHIVEVFFLIDYLDYQKFYMFNNNDSTAALNDLTLFYAFTEECMNIKYGTIPEVDSSLTVEVRSTGIFVAQTANDQQWISNNLNGTTIEKDGAIEDLRAYIVSVQSGLPVSDHYMAFTGGDLESAAGYAYIGTVCTTAAVSLVENSFDGFTCGVAAHELGHSLNCQHDGLLSPTCSDSSNNVMATILNFPTGVSDAPNPWRFSTCSVSAIKAKLQSTSCTLPANTPSTSKALSTQNTRAGQVYDADEQCKRISNDSTVRFCRNFYTGNPTFNDMCWVMFCGKAGGSCSYNIAYEGTSCGNGMWCDKGLCVENENAPKRYSLCPQGDDPTAGCDPAQCSTYSIVTRLLTCCASCSTETSPGTSPLSTSPTSSPITSPQTSPVTSPISSPNTSPQTSQITSPNSSPNTSPQTSQFTSPTSSPNTSPQTSPSTSPTASPVTSPSSSPITSPETSPSTSPNTSPVISAETSPVTSLATSPMTSPETSRTTSSAASPTVSPETSPMTSSPETSPVTSAVTQPNVISSSPTLSQYSSPNTSPNSSPITSQNSSPNTSQNSSPITSQTSSPAANSPTTTLILASPTVNLLPSTIRYVNLVCV